MNMPPEPTLKDLFRAMNEMRDVVNGIREDIESLRDEIRAARRDFGQDIDVIKARMTTDKASIDEMLAGLHRDLSRDSTITKSTLDSHTARFRKIDGKLDELKDQGRTIIQRRDRRHVSVK